MNFSMSADALRVVAACYLLCWFFWLFRVCAGAPVASDDEMVGDKRGKIS